jgi:hypothetical protein
MPCCMEYYANEEAHENGIAKVDESPAEVVTRCPFDVITPHNRFGSENERQCSNRVGHEEGENEDVIAFPDDGPDVMAQVYQLVL